MKLGDFLLGLAFLKGNGKDAVLLVQHSGRNHNILECAIQSDDFTYDTPIVNLLQNIGVSRSRGCWLYATYVPSEMDLGMACMRGVAGVVYPSGPATAAERTLSDEGGPSAPGPYSGRDNTWDIYVSRTGRVANLDTPWGRLQRWQDTRWVQTWGARLTPRDLGGNAASIVDSYANLRRTFNSRPVSDIDKLQRHVSQGLDRLDCTPLLPLTQEWRDNILMTTAFALVGCSWSSEGRVNRRTGRKEPTTRDTGLHGGHNIGALMVDKNNKIIGWSLNVNVINGTFHAETAMVLAYLRRHNVATLPDGCRIYATLKPCHMCAGFIATVAKNVTVIYGQNDPKITNSALDNKRGIGIIQKSAELGVGVGTSYGTYRANKNMTVSEALAEMIGGSGLNAVPFLYSNLARSFYMDIRGKPWKLDRAIRKFTELPPVTNSLGLRSTGPQPERGLRTVGLLAGVPLATTIPRSMGGLDLATGSAMIRAPTHPVLPVSGFNRGEVRNRVAQGATVDFVDPSPTLDALDLAIGKFNVLRMMSRRPDNRTLMAIIFGLGVAERFLRGLKDKNILTLPV